VPAGLTVSFVGAPQTNAGTYAVTAVASNANYLGTARGIFVINRVTPVVSLSNLTQTYTGAGLSPNATTFPAGLHVVFSGVPQTNAGSYAVTAMVNDPNANSVSSSGTFVIQKATARVALNNLAQTYTGSPLSPNAITTPTGLNVVLTGAPQTNAGSYQVTETVNDPNYQGSATTSFLITPAPSSASVTVTPLYYSGGTTSATNPPPAVCSGATSPCQKYSDPVDLTVSLSPTNLGGSNDSVLNSTTCGTTTAPCVNVTMGSQTYGPIPLSFNATTQTLTGSLRSVPILQAPADTAYAVQVSPVSTVNQNYSLSTPASSLLLKQETAILTYSGLTDFTTNSGASTQNITVSYSFQDPSSTAFSSTTYDPYAGDITKASPTLKLTGTTSVGMAFTAVSNPIAVASTLAVNGIPANGIATYVVPNVPVNGSYTLTASPAAGSYYTWSTNSTTVAITNGNDGAGQINGHGAQTAEYLAISNRAGGKFPAFGLITPAPGTKVEFDFQGKYKHKGIDARAVLRITANGPKKTLRKYEISSDTIENGYQPQPFAM
jgi:hypothetical protein